MTSLNRQIFIWKDCKKADLNDILTDEGEVSCHGISSILAPLRIASQEVYVKDFVKTILIICHL